VLLSSILQIIDTSPHKSAINDVTEHTIVNSSSRQSKWTYHLLNLEFEQRSLMDTTMNSLEYSRRITKKVFHGLTWKFPKLWWFVNFRDKNRIIRGRVGAKELNQIKSEFRKKWWKCSREQQKIKEQNESTVADRSSPASLAPLGSGLYFGWWLPTDVAHLDPCSLSVWSKGYGSSHRAI